MNTSKLRLSLGVLIAVTVAASIAMAPAAYAMNVPAAGGEGTQPAAQQLARTVVVSTGLPTWQVAVIAIGSAILGVAATTLMLWTRTRRLQLSLRAS